MTRRDAAFNEGHLPGSVGETSVVSIGDKPGIKLDARPVDIQPTTTKTTTTTTKDSAKSGGKPTTTKDSKHSGGFVPLARILLLDSLQLVQSVEPFSPFHCSPSATSNGKGVRRVSEQSRPSAEHHS